MPRARSYSETSLSQEGSAVLEIGGEQYTLVKYQGSFALNEIPQAVCTVATGRRATSVDQANARAQIHESGPQIRHMQPARVYLNLAGESRPGRSWPEDRKLVFDGYVHGFTFRKTHNSLQAVIKLIHWLVDLSFSSALSETSHPSNPGSLIGPISQSAGGGLFGASGQPKASLPEHLNATFNFGLLDDVWGGIKQFLWQVAETEDMFKPRRIAGRSRSELGFDADPGPNTRALQALRRIEGPAPDAAEGDNLEYKLGQALPLQTISTAVENSAIDAMNHQRMAAYKNQTLWEVLVRGLLPEFGMTLCPMVDRAVVVAQTPAYRTDDYWKTLAETDYSSIDLDAQVSKPLQAVAIAAEEESDTLANVTQKKSPFVSLGGIFAQSSDEDTPGPDGVLLVRRAPRWIKNITLSVPDPPKDNKPVRDSTDPEAGEAPDELPKNQWTNVEDLMSRYARMLYVQNVLRGRRGPLSGPLRFDIGPGSHIKVEGSPEQFLEGSDKLAASMFAQVTRTTVIVDAQSRRATTSFSLSHIRDEVENEADRTSLDQHPFYGDNVTVGLPLSVELDES